MKILHCITSLEPDGAQQMLRRLVVASNPDQFQHVVVSLRERMPLADQLESAGARVFSLDMKAGVPSLGALMKLRKIIISEAPDLIQGWLYHANCAVTLAVLGISPAVPVVWGIRGSLDPGWGRGLMTNLVIRFSSLLSGLPDVITFNSRVSIAQHRSEGYRAKNERYIPNGFELSRLAPDTSARQRIIDQFQIPADALIVGIAGRYNRAKDYPGFVKAFRLVLNILPNAHAVMIGREVDRTNQELCGLIDQLGIGSQVRLLGARPDLATIFPAFDLFCSSSLTEGFPNVVAEALACEVPCVVTAVGMGAELVEGAGLSVPAGQPEALSQAILSLLKLPQDERKRLGVQGRQRICAEFDLAAVVAQYEGFYREVCRNFQSK